jgi:hypothetical protein
MNMPLVLSVLSDMEQSLKATKATRMKLERKRVFEEVDAVLGILDDLEAGKISHAEAHDRAKKLGLLEGKEQNKP